jgi:hypothetical protein
VIEKNTLTDDGARVDFNARQKARNMGSEAAQPLEAMDPKPMRGPMEDDRMQSGVASDDLPGAARSRVAVQNTLNIRTDTGKHGS